MITVVTQQGTPASVTVQFGGTILPPSQADIATQAQAAATAAAAAQSAADAAQATAVAAGTAATGAGATAAAAQTAAAGASAAAEAAAATAAGAQSTASTAQSTAAAAANTASAAAATASTAESTASAAQTAAASAASTAGAAASTASGAQSTASAAQTAASAASAAAAAAAAAAGTAGTTASQAATAAAAAGQSAASAAAQASSAAAAASSATTTAQAAQTAATSASASVQGLASTIANSGTLGLVRDGGLVKVDQTAGTLSIPDGQTIPSSAPALAGRPTPSWSTADLGNALLASNCITNWGPIGDSVNGDDATLTKALNDEMNSAAPGSWGASAKGKGGMIWFPPGCSVYVKQTHTITGSVALVFPGGKQSCRVIPINPQSMRYVFVVAMNGLNGNTYSNTGSPKGSIVFDGICIWDAGSGSAGLYGPDPADSTGVLQMSCPWYGNGVANDRSVNTTGNFTITGPNGENGPICSPIAPIGRHDINFQTPTAYTVTLLSQGAPSGDIVAAGTVGTPLIISDGSGNWLVKMTINAGSIAAVAGDYALFINGISGVFHVNDPVSPIKPFVEYYAPMMNSLSGCGLLTDMAWNGQIRGYAGGVITKCGADNVLYLGMYDGSIVNWEISLGLYGGTCLSSATIKFEACNMFSNKRANGKVRGSLTTGAIHFTRCETDHCHYGHGLDLNNSNGLVYVGFNDNLSGQLAPNTKFGLFVGQDVPPHGIVLDGCGFQKSAANSPSQTGMGTIGFAKITTIAQVKEVKPCKFLDTTPLWGQLVNGGGTTSFTGIANGVSTPDTLNNPVSLATSPLIPATTTTSTIVAPSAVVPLNATAGIVVGMTAIASGIPLNVTVASIQPGVSVTLSQAVGLSSGLAIQFSPIGQSVVTYTTTDTSQLPSSMLPVVSAAGLVTGMSLFANGASASLNILSISGNTLTLTGNVALGSGVAVGFQPGQLHNLPGGIEWNSAPRGGIPTVSINGQPLISYGTAPGGTDGVFGWQMLQSKDAGSGPVWMVWDRNNTGGINVPGAIEGLGTGGLVLSPSGGPVSIPGTLLMPTLPKGIIVNNGTAAATSIPAPVSQTIAGGTSASTPAVLPVAQGVFFITGTGAGPVWVQAPPMAQYVAAGIIGPITVKDKDGNAATNALTFQTTGATLIDGVGSKPVNSNYGALTYGTDGVNLYVTA